MACRISDAVCCDMERRSWQNWDRHSVGASMLPKLSSEQRRALAEIGTPVPVFDPTEQSGYILVPTEINSDPLGGYLAAIPSIPAVGGGDTPEDALMALSAILPGLLASREDNA